MNVEDFVKETLSQIFRGVKAAATIADEVGARIDPTQYGDTHVAYDEGQRTIQDIEFDIAVSVNETGDISGGISVMGLGLKAVATETSNTVSRIKFKIPVVFPK